MINIASKQIVPAVIRYTGELAQTINAIKAAGVDAVSVQSDLLKEISALLEETATALAELIRLDNEADAMTRGKEQAMFYRKNIVPAMKALRRPVDALETMVDKSVWPMPSYGDLLFEV